MRIAGRRLVFLIVVIELFSLRERARRRKYSLHPPPPPPKKKELVLVPATLAKIDHSPPSPLVTKINTFSLPGKRSLGMCPVAHFILLESHCRRLGKEPFESLA